MSKITYLPLSSHYKPEQALKAAMVEVETGKLKHLLVLGEYKDNELLIIPSNMKPIDVEVLAYRLLAYVKANS